MLMNFNKLVPTSLHSKLVENGPVGSEKTSINDIGPSQEMILIFKIIIWKAQGVPQ